MHKEINQNEVPEAAKSLLDHQRQAYQLVDERRRKNFLLLFSFTVIFLHLFARDPRKSVEFPLLGIDVSYIVAMQIAPIFLTILMVSHHYLCHHTIRNYIAWSIDYFNLHSVYFKEKGKSYAYVYNACKRRDVTEHLNIYLCFEQENASTDKPKWRRCIYQKSTFFLRLTVLMAPILLNGMILCWLWKNYEAPNTSLFATTMLIILSFTGLVVPLLSYCFFLGRVTEPINDFRTRKSGKERRNA